MATLYEIKEEYLKALEGAFDLETGEVLDVDKMAEADKLFGDFNSKIDNIICYIKNLKADAEALKVEKNNLAERQKAKENKAESLTKYLQSVLEGNKYESTVGKVSYRKSVSVEVDLDVFQQDERAFDFLNYEPKADKTALKKALEEGLEINGAKLVEKNNMQIK